MSQTLSDGTATPIGAVGAVDIGGTKIAVAVIDRAGDVLARASAPTPATEGAEAILATAARLVEEAGRSAGVELVAIGVGAAGVVDPATGIVLGATDTLTGWAGTDIRAGLTELLGLPVAAVNDVHAHGLGEAAYGGGRGHTSVLTVAVGTGIGGALVVDGRLVAGRHAAAGHVGHVPSGYAAVLRCSCGAAGHLEAFASGPSLTREYVRRTRTEVASLHEVRERAGRGEVEARQLIAEGGAAVGEVIAGLINVIDPDVVVVGGGVVGLGEEWWTALSGAVGVGVLPMLAGTPVVRSGCGGDGAVLGAAAVAWRLLDELNTGASHE
ncbi:ROK family protein [Nocardioides sp.]|uniref:ROK family protein n=1 Tax=Nocardioides sp. TaxID=35761 RepID=UPI0026093406|nr:ROK family protein [Nocardioides sp.]